MNKFLCILGGILFPILMYAQGTRTIEQAQNNVPYGQNRAVWNSKDLEIDVDLTTAEANIANLYDSLSVLEQRSLDSIVSKVAVEEARVNDSIVDLRNDFTPFEPGDTIWLDANTYMVDGGTDQIKVASKNAGSTILDLMVSSSYTGIKRDVSSQYLYFTGVNGVRIGTGSEDWYIDNNRIRNSTDTLITAAAARALASTGTVDVSGSPAANQLTKFVDGNTITTTGSTLVYESSTLRATNPALLLDSDTSIYALTDDGNAILAQTTNQGNAIYAISTTTGSTSRAAGNFVTQTVSSAIRGTSSAAGGAGVFQGSGTGTVLYVQAQGTGAAVIVRDGAYDDIFEIKNDRSIEMTGVTPVHILTLDANDSGNPFRIRDDGTTVFEIDSIGQLTEELVCLDSIRLDYAGVGDEGAWLYLTPTQAIDTGSFLASFALNMELVPLKYSLLDTKNGEIAWYHQDKKGEIVKTYGFKGVGPMNQLEALTAGVEINRRYIYDLECKLEEEKQKNKELENRLKNLEYIVSTLIDKK